MLRTVGMGVATASLIAGCSASPDRVPEPIETVNIIQEVPAGANFYEEPVINDSLVPCGATIGRLIVTQPVLNVNMAQTTPWSI